MGPRSMEHNALRIVFMGTPEFAVESLRALLDGPDEVVLVIAQPDKPAGRGGRLRSPPTIRLAKERGVPTAQPRKVRDRAFADLLRSHRPDVIVVVAYGRILTPDVLAIPPHGCINVHASLLPRHRGASPIQWAILRGDSVTGITTMQMDEGMDTGDVLLKEEVPITPDMDARMLHDVLAPLGARTLMKTLDLLKRGALRPTPQAHEEATIAPLLTKEDGRLDWSRSAIEIDRRVRAMTPWPGAFTFLGDRRLIVLKGKHVSAPGHASPGTVVDSSGRLVVATGDGCYRIERVKAQNSRAMDVSAFLNGHPIPPGTILGGAPPTRSDP